MNVSKCSGWEGRVNELEEISGAALDGREAALVIYAGLAGKTGRVGSFNIASRACRARLACLVRTSRTTYEEGGFLEGIEQSLGNFQITTA